MQLTPWNKIKGLFVHSDADAEDKKPAQKEKRLARRKSQRLVNGFIWSEGMAFSKECSIRDLSVTGARVDLLNDEIKSHTLTGILTLYLPSDKREIDCKVKWQSGRMVGLQFIGSYRAPTRRYGA
jgi:hypothetical protein